MKDARGLVAARMWEAWIEKKDEIDLFVRNVAEQSTDYLNGNSPPEGGWVWSNEETFWNPVARSACALDEWTSPLSKAERKIYRDPDEEADAVVTVPGFPTVAAEIKIVTDVHDVNSYKWAGLVNHDTEKLALRSTYPGLQIIIAMSSFDLENSSDWQRWFRRVHIWNHEPLFMASCAVLTTGKLVVKAWGIPADDPSWLRKTKQVQ